MTELRTIAHAKLNLTLDVLRRRPDGYHDLQMVMQEISLGDEIILRLDTGAPWSVIGGSQEIPYDESNLAVKAAQLFFQKTGVKCTGLTLEIHKHIPVCAGMGGGSTDGAAVLRLLYDFYNAPISKTELYCLAEQTGSDVPFALFGGTALAEGKGQILTRLPSMGECFIVLCKPPFPISTPELFQVIDREKIIFRPDTEAMISALQSSDIQGVAKNLCNVFEPVVARKQPDIMRIKTIMLQCGALGASMTGSGPTIFGIYRDQSTAQAAYIMLKAQYLDTFLAEPV